MRRWQGGSFSAFSSAFDESRRVQEQHCAARLLPKSRGEEQLRAACGFGAGVAAGCLLVLLAAVPLFGAQVRVREGTLVTLKLHNDLTTENVVQGDRIDFEVADNALVDGHVVIAKGALATGTVIRVKGGKKKAREGSVTFRLTSVRAVDNQEIPIRSIPQKNKKTRLSDNEIEESNPIRGLEQGVIGAEKGKGYAAYTDTDLVVNGLEAPPASAATGQSPAAPAGQTGTPAPGSAPGQSPAAPTVVNPAPAAPAKSLAAELLAPEQGSIAFASEPAGAEIVIDNNFVGSTPSTLRVPPGRHTIEIRLAGYRSWSRTMMVGPGSHPSIRAALEKQ